MTRFWMLLFLPLLVSCTAIASQPMVASAATPATSTEPTRVKHSLFASNAIPELLLSVSADPYARPVDSNCAALATEIKALNDILGEDLDALTSTDAKQHSDLVINTVQGFIPYSGWLRRLSGATKRERRLLAAMAAGAVRRAYLKGLGEAQACSPPAAPMRALEINPAK